MGNGSPGGNGEDRLKNLVMTLMSAAILGLGAWVYGQAERTAVLVQQVKGLTATLEAHKVATATSIDQHKATTDTRLNERTVDRYTSEMADRDNREQTRRIEDTEERLIVIMQSLGGLVIHQELTRLAITIEHLEHDHEALEKQVRQ
jgi:hypothetical protein